MDPNKADINDKDRCGSRSANGYTYAPAIETASPEFLVVGTTLRSRDVRSIRGVR